jgi:uracil-DNA glycosylase
MELANSVQAIDTWETWIANEKKQAYFQAIANFLKKEKAAGKIIYPRAQDILNAFRYTPLEEVRVVILGQDPYHGVNQAQGLCFSVPPGVPQPPSLKNIFLALQNDLGIKPPLQGCLIPWAKQGVLLLNTVLTVEANKPQSHANIGWETFSDHVIHLLNTQKKSIVFLLWGSSAQRKEAIIDTHHHILKSVHPSPLSAHRGFLTCKHFSKTNELLRNQGEPEIDWRL